MNIFFPGNASVLLLAVSLFFLTSCGQSTSTPARAIETQELQWSQLVPDEWDAPKRFQGMELMTLHDADPEARKILKEMELAWESAPVNTALHGTAVWLTGFVVPLDNPKQGIREFLLVPYHGACIHTPPPPANQIVYVKLAAPVTGIRPMEKIRVGGVLKAILKPSQRIEGGGYELQDARVEISGAAKNFLPVVFNH